MGFKASVKNFGARAEDAVLKEFSQLNDYNCLTPRRDLTKEEKKMALEYLMIIQEKRDGRIKATGCADGRKQRGYLLKEEVSSPTVSFDSLMMSSLIDSYEKRKVITVDIPGAYLQSKLHQDEKIFIVLRGKMAELLCQTNLTKYRPHLRFSNDEPYIYAQLNKSLYGTLQGALRLGRFINIFTGLGFYT